MARSVNPGSGCLTVFGLAFVGAALLCMVMGGRALARGEHNAWVPVVVGVVFSIFGVGIVVLARFSARARPHIMAEASRPDALWSHRADWAAGEVKSSDKQNLIAGWFFAVFWNVISIPVAVFLPQKIRTEREYFLALFFIFPVVGVFLFIRAIRATIQFRKFGSSRFKMLSVPGVIGGTLSGVIHTATKIRSANRFLLTLRCTQRITTGSGKNRHTEERVLWEDQKNVREMDGGESSGIPVLFQIPAGCSATSPAQSISWKLEAKADVPGVDFETSFEVPVFEVAAEARPAANVAEFAARCEEPADFASTLAASGVRVRSNGNETEFTFAAARNKGAAFVLTLIMAVFLSLYALPVKLKNEAFFLIVWSVFAAVFLYWTTKLWTAWSRVRVGPDGLRLTKRWLLIPLRRTLPRALIREIKTKFGMSAGRTTYYDLQAVTEDGKCLTLATSIRGQREADWLATEMRRALGTK